MNPSYPSELDSPNDMLVDTDDLLVDPDNEKDDIAIITPESELELPSAPRADDYEAMKELIFPPLDGQPPILVDAHHTWEIQEWNKEPRKAHGPIFEAGGFPWRVLLFPAGNNSDNASLYLEHGYDTEKPPDDFVCCVHFSLVMWNPTDPEVYVHHQAHHRFTKDEGDWGFTRFIELRKLYNSPCDDKGRYMVTDDFKVNITTYVRIVKDETGVLWHNFTNYDSKEVTGFVGLKNQGATCYLNSLIQSLYFTNAFRKAVYQIPTQNEETLQNSAYTLQRLFYQLQNSNNAVGTNELTKSFGWETRHIFEQQDVQELSRKLMERMEEKMKGTEAENVLPKLFCGKVRTYISCINVEYESRRVEDFWDIQLNVHGNKTLEDSFKDYIQVEIMDGENKYFAGDEHKLQDAKKGVIFESFPEVLHLQLKRFQYDIERDAMMKINDRYEFPESFDAAPFLSEDADMSEPWNYKLHGVLVHSGDLNAGHYYAFIKPEKDGWFYKYDDDRVTRATMRDVLDENYGGLFLNAYGQPISHKGQPVLRQNSAYMLVYIRESRLDNVLLPLTKDDTPAHLQKKLDEEAAIRDARKKEREEQHLYIWIKIITDDTFRKYGGTDLASFDKDLSHDNDKSAPRSYRFLRKSTVKELAEQVGKDTEVDPRRLRFWCMVNRQNKTVRPDTPVTDNSISVEEAHQKLAGTKSAELRLWCEMTDEVGPDGEPVWPTTPILTNGNGTTPVAPPKNDLIVLFLKHFDIENQTLNGEGHIYISREKKVEDLVPAILTKMGWSDRSPSGEKVQLKLFEEIKPNMIEPMKAKQTLKAAELQDGDIVCFQLAESKSSESRNMESSQESLPTSTSTASMVSARSNPQSVSAIGLEPILDARLWYDFLLHKRVVTILPHPTRTANPETVEKLVLTLTTKHSYDTLSTIVGERLGVNPTHLRFWTVNATTNQPKTSVKRGPHQTLQTILMPPYSTFSNNNQRPDALFYELLDMSLSELDTKKTFKVIWVSEGTTKEEPYDILVPKNGVVQDIVDGLIKKAQLDDEEKGGPIRLYECHSGKINKEPSREAQVLSITDYVQVVAERIPEEDLDSEAKFIQAYHFQNEPSKSHGIPFRFLIKPDEAFSETKKRLEKRTGMKGKNFEKIKFAVVKRSSYQKPTYLADDDILFSLVDPDNDHLGLDHIDRTRSIRNGAGDLFLK